MAWQALCEACHSPPAFSQSAWFVIVESDVSLEVPPVDGLADGDAGDEPDDGDEPEDEPGLALESVPPVLPELLGAPLDPAAPLEPLPLPAWAAAIAGAKQTMPIKSRDRIFFI